MLGDEVDIESTSAVVISCGICGNPGNRIYELTLINEREWWINNITLGESALEATKIKFHRDVLDFDDILDALVGIAKYRDGTLHVCFRISDVRGYYTCEFSGKMYTLMYPWRIEFGR